MRITGTFLDEITVDIPSNNLGPKEWANEFRAMKHIGIDTVIIIRSGHENRCIFQSKALEKHIGGIMPVYEDLCELFLQLSEENGIDLYFGTYDSYKKMGEKKHQEVIDINRDFVDEAWERYGSFKAFNGWYITQELSVRDEEGVQCIKTIADHCKSISDNKLPTLISPYISGKKQFDNPITLGQHAKDWDHMLAILQDSIDYIAFQDGNVDYHELNEYVKTNNDLIKKYGMTPWSNLETFDRDMPFNFPPSDWRSLWWKLEVAKDAQVQKIITFEFSKFMSPYSCWPSANNLYDRYCDHFGIERLER